jgi:hypothetical protein
LHLSRAETAALILPRAVSADFTYRLWTPPSHINLSFLTKKASHHLLSPLELPPMAHGVPSISRELARRGRQTALLARARAAAPPAAAALAAEAGAQARPVAHAQRQLLSEVSSFLQKSVFPKKENGGGGGRESVFLCGFPLFRGSFHPTSPLSPWSRRAQARNNDRLCRLNDDPSTTG